MVFKPLNLARQSFIKTFTHGYAQSLVAASQSSSASQNTSFHTLGSNVTTLLAKGGPHAQTQNALQLQTGASGASGATAKTSNSDITSTESGLAAYYAAWQRHHNAEEKELHQFQFAKRIGWKAPTTIPDGPTRSRENTKRPATANPSRRTTLTRSNTTSAIDQIRPTFELHSLEGQSNEDGLVDRAPEDLGRLTPSALNASESLVPEKSVSPPALVDASSSAPSVESQSPSKSTEATSIATSETLIDQITSLAERQRYGEIPGAFESMLATGITPTASTYNALLLAAINLPRGKHQVASKVLDVYADMLRRRVLPDTSTYAILIELLAARAIDVIAMKQDLNEKLLRYGSTEESASFLLRSDETETQILAEDDALSFAVKLFDTSAAVSTRHVFPTETYRLLISACAETGRIGDMVRIYASLESHGMVASSAIFAPMIAAFARIGDLRSAVECYDVYKGLAIANNDGANSMVRKDDEIYAAVIEAYATCGRLEGGLQFLHRIEGTINDEYALAELRDTVWTKSIYPHWLQNGRHKEVMEHASENLSAPGQAQALSYVCMDASKKNMKDVANDSFRSLVNLAVASDESGPAMALVTMNARAEDVSAATEAWNVMKKQTPHVAFVEPTIIFALCLIKKGLVDYALTEASHSFARIREQITSNGSQAIVHDRIDEAIEVIASDILKRAMCSPSVAIQLLRAMADNGRAITSATEQLLAFIGPDQVSGLAHDDMKLLTQIEASLLANPVRLDVAHELRFAHLLDLTMARGAYFDEPVKSMIERALAQSGRTDLIARWQSLQISPETPALLPVQFPASPAYTASSLGYEDNYDPYGSSTDFKGSTFIADELDKPHGSHAQHLQEALFRFRNMRRIGRHPRYATYSKLIGSAAKENQFETAEDILAMAKQDVPYLHHSAVVHNGWIAILDSMVSACLTVGKRDQAARYHQDLLNIGAAPSANTFGLYITTLKESTKTFDEATEAVKIFHQAKAEGVEPTSFLYNALIGKLGKARRIDDCLFYFAEMRALGIRPTSVTYGTVVNALCRVSDDKFAEQLFEEMESCTNYKPRPAPYNSLMQYFLTTKRDRSKVLSYYERMKTSSIQPTMHTYKLLIDTYATLTPIDLPAAERVIDEIRAKGHRPEPVHFASLIHAKGCVLGDMAGARALFDQVTTDGRTKPHACLYQALFESYVANHDVPSTEPLLDQMKKHAVRMTPYIANTLIHGWATAKDIGRARAIYDALGRDAREPSTYEAMTRAHLSVEQHGEAKKVVGEALRRGYPAAVAGKICELVAPGGSA